MSESAAVPACIGSTVRAFDGSMTLPLPPCSPYAANRTAHRDAPVRRFTATRPSFFIRCNRGMDIVSATRCEPT